MQVALQSAVLPTLMAYNQRRAWLCFPKHSDRQIIALNREELTPVVTKVLCNHCQDERCMWRLTCGRQVQPCVKVRHSDTGACKTGDSKPLGLRLQAYTFRSLRRHCISMRDTSVQHHLRTSKLSKLSA